MQTQPRWALLLLSTVLLTCGDATLSASSVPRSLVSVALSSSGLRVLGLSDERPRVPEQTSARLSWTLTRDAEVLAAGELADPRELRSEFDALTTQTAHAAHAEVATLTLELPQVPGTLTLYEGTGADRRELGQTEFEGPQTAVAQALMSEADVVEAPTYFSGSRASEVRLLFVGDGYQSRELDTFRADSEQLFKGVITMFPDYRQYAGKMAGARAVVRSPASGIDDPERRTKKTTAFELSYGTTTRRCIWFQTYDGVQAAQRLRAQAGADVVVVVANTEESGGCALDGVIVLSRGDGSVEVLAHELGHALFGLDDEYDYGNDSCRPTTVGSSKNVSVSMKRDELPWKDLVLPSTPLPTPLPPDLSSKIVGAFEGAGYCAHHRWRPQQTCMMRQLGMSMCQVCAREMVKRLGDVAPACTPGSQKTCSVPHGSGLATCSESGVEGSCVATACESGYQLSNGACISLDPQVCTPGARERCAVANGQGQSTCLPDGSGFGACEVTSCDDGFVLTNGGCVSGAQACPRTASALAVGTVLTCSCSAESLASTRSVYGTNVYTDDSHVCRAARHAGQIPETGGVVTLTRGGRQSKFTGSFQNGIKSKRHGKYGGSFSF